MAMTLVLVLGVFAIAPNHALADCLSFDLSSGSYSNDQLKQMLAECNAESAQTQQELTDQKAKSSSLASDVSLLNSLIKKASQQIAIKNQIITQLGSQISQKQNTIETLSAKLGRENDSLSQILRHKNEIDTMTLTEMLLSKSRISDFFLDVDNFQDVNKSLQDSLNTIKGIRTETDAEKTVLQQQQTEQANLKNQIEAQKIQTQNQQNEKAALLANSKQQEKTYQQLLAAKQAQASKISAALFKLAGGSKAIPFGTAYQYATIASNSTGVRAAFILAILKQESNYGVDSGGCYVSNLSNGSGTRASNGEVISTVMKAPRDTVPFQTILAQLGLSPSMTQVSCPQKVSGSYMGYGGAMGPSQFIPSTWILYADKIANALHEQYSNPWDAQDAVMATALFMRDLGANNSSQERTAACKYYSGHGCSGSASSYGSSVIRLEGQIQSDINIINDANNP